MEIDEKTFTAVRDSQKILAEYIVPNSGISDHNVISRLLGVLDSQDLVKHMKGHKIITVLNVIGEGFNTKLECQEADKYGSGIIYVNPFVGCAVEVPEDISFDDYVSVAKKMIGKKYSMPLDTQIFRPEYLPQEGEFTEIKD